MCACFNKPISKLVCDFLLKLDNNAEQEHYID